jgi:hypothetical protein
MLAAATVSTLLARDLWRRKKRWNNSYERRFFRRQREEAFMQTRDLFQQRARECVRMAQKAPSDERVILLELARTWRLLADAVDEASGEERTIH